MGPPNPKIFLRRLRRRPKSSCKMTDKQAFVSNLPGGVTQPMLEAGTRPIGEDPGNLALFQHLSIFQQIRSPPLDAKIGNLDPRTPKLGIFCSNNRKIYYYCSTRKLNVLAYCCSPPLLLLLLTLLTWTTLTQVNVKLLYYSDRACTCNANRREQVISSE